MDSLPRGCRLIDFRECADERGCLSVAESRQQVPFAIERVFWIYGVPEGQSRGEHSHNECTEVVVPVCGAFDMMVDDGDCRDEFMLDSPSKGLWLPAGCWGEQFGHSPDCILLVLASLPYDTADYIRSYDEFIAWKKKVGG